jgi:hypothetical protein
MEVRPLTRHVRKAVFAVLVASATAVAGLEALAPVNPAGAVVQFDHSAKILQAPRARLETRLKWDIQHIKKLQHRRTYLKHYIRDLRSKLHPTTPSTSPPTSSSPSTTSTTSTSAPAYTGGVLSDAQVTSYLLAAGFPESTIPTMLFYSHRESGNNPSAINSSSGACGLFQLYPCYGGSAWLDPATNARLAYQKYQASGFSPWGG